MSVAVFGRGRIRACLALLVAASFGRGVHDTLLASSGIARHYVIAPLDFFQPNGEATTFVEDLCYKLGHPSDPRLSPIRSCKLGAQRYEELIQVDDPDRDIVRIYGETQKGGRRTVMHLKVGSEDEQTLPYSHNCMSTEQECTEDLKSDFAQDIINHNIQCHLRNQCGAN